jgi:two-component sensor histidine kinase
MRLGMLVAGTTLPLILFAAGLVFYNYEQDREDASQRVLETVRSIRFELDAEVQRMTGGLQVLALTDALGQSEFEFERFRQISSGFLDQYGENASVLVSDRNGHQVFSSISANTTSLPSRHNLEIIDKVFTTGKPQYSDLFFGVVNKRPIVTVEVPAFHDGRVLYDVSFSPPIAKFQSIIEEQRPSNEWTISIFDTNGVSFAGVPNRTETFGKRASPSLYQEMFRGPEAKLQTSSLEGVLLFTAYTRSSVTGWIVAAGIPEASVAGPFWRNLAVTSVIGILLLLVGLGFAVRMATTIARGETLHELLIRELNHRVKNTLAILQAMAAQTFRSASAAERSTFEGRIGALAEAHDLLSIDKWQGSDLQEVVGRVLQPYRVSNSERIRMFGPKVPLEPRVAVVLSMIVHEIASNAAKYGALSNEGGTVTLSSEIVAENGKRKLRFIWTETGGPRVVAPVHRGFGSRLIERSARDQLGGGATVDFLPHGVVYAVTCSLEEDACG